MKKTVFILVAALAALAVCLAEWQRYSASSGNCSGSGISTIQEAQPTAASEDAEIVTTVDEDLESEITAGFFGDLWNSVKWWWRYNVAGWKHDGKMLMTTEDGEEIVIGEVHLG